MRVDHYNPAGAACLTFAQDEFGSEVKVLHIWERRAQALLETVGTKQWFVAGLLGSLIPVLKDAEQAKLALSPAFSGMRIALFTDSLDAPEVKDFANATRLEAAGTQEFPGLVTTSPILYHDGCLSHHHDAQYAVVPDAAIAASFGVKPPAIVAFAGDNYHESRLTSTADDRLDQKTMRDFIHNARDVGNQHLIYYDQIMARETFNSNVVPAAQLFAPQANEVMKKVTTSSKILVFLEGAEKTAANCLPARASDVAAVNALRDMAPNVQGQSRCLCGACFPSAR